MKQRLIAIWALAAVFCPLAAGAQARGNEPQNTLRPLEGKAPQNVEELYADFDPRREPLETQTVREWRKDGIQYRDYRIQLPLLVQDWRRRWGNVPTTSGPLPAGHSIKGSEVTVGFQHADGGLMAKGGELKGFSLAGEDQQWHPVQARIEGKQVIVSSPEVKRPIAVRYAWQDNPDCNLYNGAGLPASPFRTDDWPPSVTNPTATKAGAENTAVTPQGEFSERIQMVHERLSMDAMPRMTSDFILADVVLDPAYPRRYSEYSGDISGRYIGALALWPDTKKAPELKTLVTELMKHQRPDGRFGDATLSFSVDDIENTHMKLLWGNGRLLVGLMEYYQTDPSPEVLESAKRLGDFFISVFDACADPKAKTQVGTRGASGYICFTQFTEGLALLWRETKDDRYLNAAKAIVPLLGQRERQHTHGYLCTLRGCMLFYESTGDASFLDEVRKCFDDLVASPEDMMIYGGVSDYFGGKHNRDEGCSEGDFVRLGLQLWRATGDKTYLESAERCLLNHLFADQFPTGDFGHRQYDDHGMIPNTKQVCRAWWCCTFHGLRALAGLRQTMVTLDPSQARVNLFLEADIQSRNWSLELRRPSAKPHTADTPSFRMKIHSAPDGDASLSIRKPLWADDMKLAVNNTPVGAKARAGYVTIKRTWTKNDTVDVYFDYALRFRTKTGQVLKLEELPEGDTEAAVFFGPWLLGVDGAFDHYFHGEPWDTNVLLVSTAPKPASQVEQAFEVNNPLIVSDAHLVFEYQHGGFPDHGTVILRPLSEHATHLQSMHTVWLTFRR